MSTPSQILRYALLRYPTLYKSPNQVAAHLFACIGNGFDWSIKTGELVFIDKINPKQKMKYDDLAERAAEMDRWRSLDALIPGANTEIRYTLEIEADRAQRKFIAGNIDDIVKCGLNTPLFGCKPSTSYYYENVSHYALAFTFPDSITKEWASELRKFLDDWQVALNMRYGTRQDYNDVSFWPEHAQQGRKMIREAVQRLHTIITGESWEAFQERSRKLMDEVMKELDTPEN